MDRVRVTGRVVGRSDVVDEDEVSREADVVFEGESGE